MIIDLKIQIEEVKRIEDILSKKLNEKNIDYERLEKKIVSLIKDSKKSKCQLGKKLKYEKSTKFEIRS